MEKGKNYVFERKQSKTCTFNISCNAQKRNYKVKGIFYFLSSLFLTSKRKGIAFCCSRMKILISYNLQLVLHTCQALRLIQQNPAAKFFVVMFHVSQEKPRRTRA